jgi:4-amino-4-deoxy-L-arabinose transferase-like glycosyltransferase
VTLPDVSRAPRALWALLVILLFCLPLFLNLRGADLRGDEAAHSYAVDRILETGDWLIPRNSPSDNSFLEKPPLKFWIVAAPMRAGLMPRNEFGMRVWDPLFGSMAFLYVFGIGRRLAGPVCGAMAVLILFVHLPLVLDHGLRSNNMEAALLLCYCGGYAHYLWWTSADTTRARRGHAVAVGLYFVLGFMVKFVAALFLPFVLVITSLIIRDYRSRLLRDWRMWGTSILIALVLATPWFAYCHVLFGRNFWHIILEEQVYRRLSGVLDPAHLHPWHFYFTQLYDNLILSRTLMISAAGGVLLLVDTIRKRWAEGVLVLLWFAAPMSLMSLGTSKLYHYAYPHLPAVALAGGYLMASLWLRVQPLVRRWFDTTTWRALGAAGAQQQLRTYQRVLLGIAIVAFGIMVWTTIFGLVHITLGGTEVFKSSTLLRPWILAVVCVALAGRLREAGRYLVVPVLIMWLLPSEMYRNVLTEIRRENHPFRSVTECIGAVRSLYVAGPDSAYGHQHTYYFRKLGPSERAMEPSAERIEQYLDGPTPQPVLVDASWYRSHAWPATRWPVNTMPLDDALLLLPGTYSRCSATANEP